METRHRPLDALRGIAILMVVLAHLDGPVENAASNHVGAIGIHGVDIFFALSGFLIGGILLDKRNSGTLFKTFYARRACRILPAYVLLLISYVVVKAIDERFRFGLIQSLYMPKGAGGSYLLLLQNNVMAYMNAMNPAWLTVTWSLAIEEQFYLVAPWVAKVASPKTIAILCLGTIVGCPLLRYALVTKGVILAPVLLLPARADALCVGVLLAVMVRSQWWPRMQRNWLGVGAVGSGLFALLFTLHGSVLEVSQQSVIWLIVYQPTVWALSSVFILAYLTTFPPASGSRILVAAGKTSYFVYLFHMPAILVGTVLAVKFGINAIYPCVGCLLVVGLLGEVSWTVIERPSQSFGRARFKY